MSPAAGRVAAALLATFALPASAAGDVPPVMAWAQAVLAADRPLLSPAAADPDWHIPAAAPGPGPAGPRAAAATAALQAALDSHLAMAQAGGWPAVPAVADLKAGDRDPAVAVLRRRLRASGDFSGEMLADPWYFDAALDAAVRRFQERHGLAVTGVLDATTRDAANVGLEERIGQLAVTLERWRWLPPDPGPRFVWVNVVTASLEVIDNGRSTLTMRVIAGHPDRPTPSLAGELRQVVFNPAWSVPRTIAVEDLLPRQLEDPGFLASRGFRVLQYPGGAEREISPAAVDWSRLGPDRFPYKLRQDPGPGNSLGRIKIAWDNPYDIYLHDTPARGLFALGRRTLSSGCVRLEDAPALATFLISQDRDWDAAATAAHIAGGATQAINLRHRLPIYIVYLTAWADADGTAHFRRDIYGRDARALTRLVPVL